MNKICPSMNVSRQRFCSVKYNDLEHAIDNCLALKMKIEAENLFTGLYLSKTDLASAFRILPVKVSQRNLLIMAANHPVTGQRQFFIEKNLPFGASSSCYLFNKFSESLRHLIEEMTGKKYQITNSLDDFLYLDVNEEECNRFVDRAIQICQKIGCPLSEEKTV